MKIYYLFIRLPWDQHTSWGWFAEVVGSWAFATAYLSVDSAFLTLFMSICEFHKAFYKMFRYKVGQLGGNECKQKKDVKQILHEAIFIHVSAERLENKGDRKLMIYNLLVTRYS